MSHRIPSRVVAIAPPQIDVVNARAAFWRERGAEVISLGQAVPGFAPPRVALEAAQASLADPDTHIYSADAGLLSLRRALCHQLQMHHQVMADPEQEVIITAGANQAFMLALLTLLEPGDEVLLPSPFFMNHEMAVRAVGAIPIEVPLDEGTGFTLHWTDLEPYLTPRTRAVVVVSPNNPTGAVYDPDELTRLVQTLIARGIYILSDETYLHFVYENARYLSLAALPTWRDGVVVLGSFSKSFAMTGWRVGYLIAAADIVAEALKIQDAMVICASVVAQQAVAATVSSAWDYALQFRETLNARRRYLQQRLATIPSLCWHTTQGGFFAFVRVVGCTDVQQLSTDILDRIHVVTIPGNFFGQAGEGFLRLSYGSVEMSLLERACDRLERYFADFNGRQEMPTDFTNVTELPGAGATRDQQARLYHRYHTAARYVAGKRVLEVACGAGMGLGYLAHTARNVVGGDFTKNLLDIAQSHYRDRLPLVCLDAQAVPFGERQFDVVIIFEAIYYLSHPEWFLSESRRVLSDNGILLICTVNKDWSEFAPSPFSTHYFAAKELRDLLLQHGFTEVEFFGAFPSTDRSVKHRIISLIRRIVIALDLMPKTLEGRARFKRVFYGELAPIAPEVEDGEVVLYPLVPIASDTPDRDHKILYVLGRVI